jgi:drug/metabolite transporter (DMT)-like permease
MTLLALSLVLLSAVGHATWNLLAKRVEGGATFIWLFTMVSIVLYTPIAAIVALRDAQLSLLGLSLVLFSSLLHRTYYLLLAGGYRAGDLSLVYPLARGTGPLLATVGAILALGERPGLLGLLGTVSIVTGAISLSGDPRRIAARGTSRAISYALLTGVVIAAYTLVDKEGVSRAHMNPLLYTWGLFTGTGIFLSRGALRDRAELRRLWRRHRRETIGIGVLGPFSYILVLAALTFAPVSYVAPVREIGILFGVVMGTRLLREGEGGRRLAAAAAMVAGVVLLSVP